MSKHEVHVKFAGKIVFVGFGSIGQGVLPLILRHIGTSADRITIVTAEDAGRTEADQFGVKFVKTRADPRELPAGPGAAARCRRFPVEFVGRRVERRAHSSWRANAARFTSIPAWSPGPAATRTASCRWRRAATTPCASRRSAAQRLEEVSDRGADAWRQPGSGVASRQAGLAQYRQGYGGRGGGSPPSRDGWAKLAQTLGIKVIHIAERDTQVANVPKAPNEFVNTWSVDGFVSEGAQPAELGWGTPREAFPGGRRAPQRRLGLRDLFEPPGREHVRAHLDAEAGHFHGFLITHSEAISLADYYTVMDGEPGRSIVRPVITPIIRATMRSCPSTNSPAATGTCRIANES